MNTTAGTIFDIQKFSTQDGPGVRTTVFLKGCPLSCRWCSNPESQKSFPQIMHFANLCKKCGSCVEACPQKALRLEDAGPAVDRALCDACGRCAAVCPHAAWSLSGRKVTVQEICDEVREDWRIFMQSGGGITCGGGEALSQPSFLSSLLNALHDELGFHTCLDTSGYAPWQTLEALLPHLDMILLDVKHMASAKHKEATGVHNACILENARRLGQSHFPVIIRLPLIRGFNDDEANLRAMGSFLRETNLRSVEIMPYHDFGVSKYAALGLQYCSFPPPDENVEDVADLLRRYDLEVVVHQH